MPLISARIVNLIKPDTAVGFAEAGEDQSVFCASVIQLQGQILGDDPALHTFEWEQSFGTPVTLVNPNTLFPTFINPQTSDIEFTLYVDRGTPFETSDTVFISRRPSSFHRTMIAGSNFAPPSKMPTGAFSVNTANSTFSNTQAIDVDFTVGAYSYNYPPDSTYSPIYKAEDLRRIKDNLGGKYWLMRDVDMSELNYPWDPLGTPQRPFSGELQGNGFSIQNLSITSTPVAVDGGDGFYDSVTMNNGFEGTNGQTTYTGTFGDTWTFDGNAQISNGQAFTGSTSAFFDGSGDRIYTANTPGLFGSGDWTVEFMCYPLTDTSNQYITNVYSGVNNRSWSISMGTNNAPRADVWSSSAGLIALTGPTNTLNENVWTHVVLMRKGTGIYIFTNGVLRDSDVGTIGASDTVYENGVTPTTDLYIGRRPGNITHFNGYIDNYRITHEARYPTTGFAPPTEFPDSILKPAGLFSYIGNGALIEEVGVTNANISGVNASLYKGVLAGSAQGPSTDDGGAVTIRDCYVSGTVDSGGSNAGGLIGHTGTNVSSTFENTLADVNVTEANTDPLYPQVQFLASFDGADLQTTYTEQSQNALVATFQTGSSRIRTTEFYSSPSSYNNNSGTARLEFPNDAALQLGSGDFTIEFFLNFVSLSGGNTFVAGHYGTSGNRPWALLVDAAAGDWLVRLNGSTVVDFTPITPLVTDKWYHVVLERNGNEWQFGVDGIRENSGALVGAMQTADDVLTWGGNFNSGAVSFLNGYIDDARITIGTARYDLASNETYDIPETPFATSTVSASVAGWAGNFQTEGVYNDNYWNTSKIDQGTGTGGDTPIAGEVDGLSGSALKTQSNYTNWDFDTVWQMPELKDNIGPAQLQNNIFGRVVNDFGASLETGTPQAVLWKPPNTATNAGNSGSEQSFRLYKGAIIEDQNPVTLGWENRRFIPAEQASALMTPGRRHRAFMVYDVEPNIIFNPATKIAEREVAYLVPETVVERGTGWPFAGGTSKYIAQVVGSAGGAAQDAINITITNPRKIALTVEDPILSSMIVGSDDFLGGTSTATLNYFVGTTFNSPDLILGVTGVIGGGDEGSQVGISITRAYGGTIG